ncbi:MAG: glycosyltransferase family 4 protein [Bacteroidales bacterium]|nr:glycosyltransferase family 4 protein [Bacteroidales bacterium]
MTVGFYLSKIQPSDGGIYQYSIYVLKMLLKCSEIEKIYIFHSFNQVVEFEQYLSHPKVKVVLHDRNGKLYNFLKKTSEFYLTRFYLKRMSYRFHYMLYNLLNPDRRFLNRYNLDVLHVPRQHSPAYNLKFPVIISMHDVQQFHFPEFFSPIERIYKSIRYFTTMSEANHVIVSYDHVKVDLKKYFRDVKTDVSVCPVPMDEDWVSGKPATGADELMKKYGIPDQIILTPAATWEHKNHTAVLEALVQLRSEGLRIFWVSTGNKTGFYPTLEKKVNALGLNDQVLFTGVVPDADLLGLYKMARLVVIPTLYEAGSGPLFEAMRYQSPVICSNVTSLPETIGNPEFVFEPGNSRQIADYIKRGLTDEAYKKRNLENSEQRISYFKNLNYAPAFIEAYQKAMLVFRTNRIVE